jgi:hypothetical protein
LSFFFALSVKPFPNANVTNLEYFNVTNARAYWIWVADVSSDWDCTVDG